jgi:hypothetical protein
VAPAPAAALWLHPPVATGDSCAPATHLPPRRAALLSPLPAGMPPCCQGPCRGRHRCSSGYRLRAGSPPAPHLNSSSSSAQQQGWQTCVVAWTCVSWAVPRLAAAAGPGMHGPGVRHSAVLLVSLGRCVPGGACSMVAGGRPACCWLFHACAAIHPMGSVLDSSVAPPTPGVGQCRPWPTGRPRRLLSGGRPSAWAPKRVFTKWQCRRCCCNSCLYLLTLCVPILHQQRHASCLHPPSQQYSLPQVWSG